MNGWLILDKPIGMSSAHAVGRVKRLLRDLTEVQEALPAGSASPEHRPMRKSADFLGGKLKIGHAGTLDPLASGILPLALGEATKTVAYMMDASKAYEFTVEWGAATDTDDSEGKITQTSDKRPTIDDINNILQEFTGEIEQMPPQYSALKVNGKRAYALAREGKTVDLKPRRVCIERLELLSSPPGGEPKSASSAQRDSVGGKTTPHGLASGKALASPAPPQGGSSTFLCHCSKGTYIRSLARDMGAKLGCWGHITALRRIKVGKFMENHAFSLDLLEEMVHKGDLSFLHPVESALDDIPALELPSSQATQLRQGRLLPAPSEHTGIVLAKSDNIPVALCEAANGQIKPVRVFNL